MATVGPTRIDRFEIKTQLAGGGMGVVYEVIDPQTGRRCAMARTDMIQAAALGHPEARARTS